MIMLAIDPGSETVGWALFQDDGLLDSGIFKAIDNKKKYPRVDERLNDRLDQIGKWLSQKISPSAAADPVDLVVAEEPWQVTGRGARPMICLNRAVGLIHGHAQASGAQFRTVHVHEWRKSAGVRSGNRQQMKEHAMDIAEALYDQRFTEDEAEAVLIGHHAVSLIAITGNVR